MEHEKMLEKYCDILVIGTEIPGLITAAFLARRGLSVQIIDSNPYIDHPHSPDPICLTHLKSKLLRSILGRLNVPEQTIQGFLNKETPLQFVYPTNRFNIDGNQLHYFEEIEREWPEHEGILKAFYENQARIRHQIDNNEFFQRLLPNSFQERRQLKKFIKAQNLDLRSEEFVQLCALDPRLNHFLKIQYLLTYQATCSEPFSYQVAEVFNPGDGAIFSVHNGIRDLKKILLDRIIHHDGVIRNKVPLNSLLFGNGVFEGAELGDGHGTILSKYVLWNNDMAELKTLLPRKWRFRKLRKKCEQIAFEHHWFTAIFEVDTLLIPEPMQNNVVAISDVNQDDPTVHILYLQVQRDPEHTRSQIHAHFLLPHSALSESEDFFVPFFDRIRDKILEIMPFSEDSLKLVFPQNLPDQPSDTLFPLYENDFEVFRHSAAKHGIAERKEKSFIDFFQFHYKTAAPNFYLSHPIIFDAFGTDAKLILGLKITDLIWQEAEKIKKRAMKSERRIA
jgi:hypothetical protein